MMKTPAELICTIGKKIYRQGFVAANDGNISARIDPRAFLITPTGISKGSLDAESLITIRGNKIEGPLKPSSEYKMHQAIYAVRSEITGIIHVHSPYATAFAMLGIGMSELLFPEVVVTLGKIPLVPYRTPSTQAFADVVGEYAERADVLLLERHGIVSSGVDLWDAYYKLERAEHVFKILAIACSLGKVKSLSRSEVDELLAAYPVNELVRKLIR
ncbi:MAG TPA: class II aldolase/adducin family protein [Candidatus Marinimicrobia bacterium]|nr:class II aldolase/adducin family protein [Candidatus Neomarinimicrobiota bacterium]